MAYVRPTPDQLQARYPRFAAVADATIQLILDEAPVDDTWLEKDFQKAIMLYAAHQLTIEGLGTGADAEVVAEYGAGVTKLKAGDTEIQFAGAAGAAGGSGSGTTFGLTVFGQQFAQLQQLNHGGPIVVGGSTVTAHAQGRDWQGWPYVGQG